MSKNPIVNATTAGAYIVLIVSVISLAEKFSSHPDKFLAPVVFLSLFTLSAAVMGYIFCYQPVQLYIDGKKKQAVNLFLHTTLIFGCFTALALALLFTGIIN
jgi:hypothetical protein